MEAPRQIWELGRSAGPTPAIHRRHPRPLFSGTLPTHPYGIAHEMDIDGSFHSQLPTACCPEKGKPCEPPADELILSVGQTVKVKVTASVWLASGSCQRQFTEDQARIFIHSIRQLDTPETRAVIEGKKKIVDSRVPPFHSTASRLLNYSARQET